MTLIRFNCTVCGKSLKAPATLAGRASKCTRCGTRLTVPGEGVSQDAEEPATEHALLLTSGKFGHVEDLIDMTAMVDIVFFLLIFFLVTSIQSLQSVINLPSPQSSAGSTSATTAPNDYLNDPAFIVVTIDEDDIVYVEDEEVYGDQNLRARLRKLRKDDPERNGMLVVGNPEATHGTLVSVLDAGADAGIKELLFSVDERNGEAGG